MQKEYEELNKKHIATWWQRGFGFVIDIFILSVIGGIIFEIFIKTETTFQGEDDNNYVVVAYSKTALKWIMLVITFLYYIVLETVFGKTIGKVITGTKVLSVKTHQKVKDDTSIIIRTLVRMIPLEWISFFANRPTGLHDTVSNTYVANIWAIKRDNKSSQKTNRTNQVFINKIKSNISVGNQRLLLIGSIAISALIAGMNKADLSYGDRRFSLERFLLLAPLYFVLFWVIVLIILWIKEGYKIKK